MQLYMTPMSPNVRRVRLTAAALDLSLEETIVDFAAGEHKRPEYLALNPNGAVPTLVDGEFVLTESRVIMQYLASKKPASGLLPADEQTRAQIARWQFWDASHFSPQLGTFTFEKIIKPMMNMGAPDQAKLDEAASNFRRFAAVLNRHLDGRRYVVGSSLTLADLTLACSLMYAQRTEVPLSDFTSLQFWFLQITELVAWKQSEPR